MGWIMPGGNMADENIGVQLARMEGKIDLVHAAQARSQDDIKDLRARVHDTSNEVMKLTGLNIQERFVSMGERLASHDTQLDECATDRAMRKGAFATVKFVYGAAGALGAGGIIALVKVFGGGH